MRRRRIALVAVGVVPALALAAAGAVVWLVDSDALKAGLANSVLRATGRELAIAGPVELAWSLTPTLALRGVSLANPPGLSRPAMAQLAGIEAQVALVPLLSRRVEVRSVVLVEPDVLLERDAAGQPNWVFAPPAAEPSTTPSRAASPTPGLQVSVEAVRVRGGRIGWRDGATTRELTVPDLTAVAAGPASPVTLAGTLATGGLGFELKGVTGPLAQIGAAGWPLRATLAGPGIQAGAEGALGPEGAVALSGSIADLANLSPVAGRPLPSLRDMQASARLTSAGASDIRVQVGASDLSAWVPGLRVAQASLAAPAMEQPVTIKAEGAVGAAPIAVSANAGSPAALRGDGPIPVQLLLLAADARVEGQGSVADLTGRGLDMAVSARVPDLAALGAMVGLSPPPPLRDLAFDARVSTTPDGALALRGMRLAIPQGDVAGDIVLGRQPRPSLRGTLVSQRLDIDGLTAMPARVAGQPSAAPVLPVPGAGTPPADRMLSDAPLPFDALRRADADLQITVNEASWRGTSYRAVTGRILLQDGRLRVDPVQAQMPGGALQAQVLADAAAPVPTLAVGLQAPGLAAGPLFAAFGAPDTTAGRVDADVQLKGQGGSVRAIAASLDGFLGLAMVEGEVDNGWLAGLLGDTLRGVPVELGGRSKVRCLALRLDATGGQGAVRAMLLDTTRLRLEGEGGVNFADETLDLHLRTRMRLGGTSIAVPVHLSGPWRSLRPRVAAGGDSLVVGAAPGPDACPAQLALARDGRPGPMPSGAVAAEPTDAGALRGLRPADLLRNLLR